MRSVLLVEDDAAMATALREGLEYEGYEVCLAENGEVGLRMASEEEPDLILLDLMLPKMGGITLCRRLRSQGRQTPIIMLTARGQEIDKVQGLRAGADDYLAKPFGFMELSARMEAVLRRAGGAESTTYRFGSFEVDFPRFEVSRDGSPLSLSAREFELLSYFIEHRGQAVSRDRLLEAVWGYASGSSSRTVDVHVAKLRKKIEDDPAQPRWIVTLHRVGYRFDG